VKSHIPLMPGLRSLLFFAIVLAGPTAAQGGVMLGDTGWTVEWTSPQITGIRFDEVSDTMIVTRKLNSFDPVDITFNQDAVAKGNKFGLKISLSFELMTNETGSDIRAFTLALTPNRPLDMVHAVDGAHPGAADPPYGVGKHPAPPHFHNGGYNFQGFFSLVSSDGNPSGDPAFTLGFAGDLPDGERIEPNGFFIHEFSVKDYQRSFTFEMTPSPTPEPSSLLLFGFGSAVALVAYRRRYGSRKGRATEGAGSVGGLLSQAYGG
jgi:hypothetical protein